MITPRWRKVLSDLWANKARTILVALSIAVGVFAVGVVSGSYSILNTDVPKAFNAANPHSAAIYTQYFDDDLLEVARRTPGVANVEGRSSLGGKVSMPGGQKVSVGINGIVQLDQMSIDLVKLVSGSPALKFKEIYLEQTSMTALGVKPGDSIDLIMGDDRIRSVRIAGIVSDVWANSYNISRSVTVYATLETMEWLGGSNQYDEMLIQVAEHGDNEQHVKAVAKKVADKISRGGREVYVTVVFRPGRHPAQQTVDAALALLGGMGMLALFLSTFLVVNTINALLSQQVRQIGVMKAIGASAVQVAGMYFVLILVFGLIALAISVPLAGGAAYLLATTIAKLLNLNLFGFRIPSDTLLIEVIIGIGIPLFAGIVPVLNGARLTVREAMTNYGLSNGGKRSFFDAVLESVRGLPRPMLLSIRNTFRKKGRLALTLSTLILGGAIFIAVFNVRSSLYGALDTTFGYILSDVNVYFGRNYRIERIQAEIKDIPGVVSIEGWGQDMAQVMSADGLTGDDVQIIAPPAGSTLIKPVMTAGRWLTAEDQNAVVVGNHYIKLHPETKIGDQITLRIKKKNYPFRIVGIYKMAGNVYSPILYINCEQLSKLRNESGQAYSIRVVTDGHAPNRQKEVAKALEQRFNVDGYSVGSIITGSEIIQQQRVTVDVLIYLLLTMSVLIAIVGGLGLMGTMSMNVLERTREIGVMRSIGAVDQAIMQMVVVEGMIIGLISWALGAVLSVPIAEGLNNVIGTSLLNVPLDYIFSMEGLIIWAIMVVVLSAVACILPARNAVRLTVRDVLAYE